MEKSIMIMAGGTGGHVFPALAVALWFKEKNWRVIWLGTEIGLESKVVPANNIDIEWLSVAGIRGKGLLKKINGLFKLLQACGQALRILRKHKPNVVLGMGGYVAGPGGVMAKFLGVPLVIHEQNRIPGTTNRLLAKIAKRVMEAFPNSFKKSVNACFTGNPLRKQFLTASNAADGNKSENLKILIIGGSQGAQALNEAIPSALAGVKDIEVWHQTGVAMEQIVTDRYKQIGVAAKVNAFINDMVSAYVWADLIICRAGAMTVSEVAAIGLPSIMVPLPNAIDNHQLANARYLEDAGATIILPQQELNAENIVQKINLAAKNLSKMKIAAKHCARLDATEAVASVCIQEASR
jgi:UDP-N-acetylglucosamine--N-acetylmuramyl-(pentapeptide) pyrophosphoryl-undecaprenol N-acetylglucosamine transferase